jgi:calcium/proton exchanger cax
MRDHNGFGTEQVFANAAASVERYFIVGLTVSFVIPSVVSGSELQDILYIQVLQAFGLFQLTIRDPNLISQVVLALSRGEITLLLSLRVMYIWFYTRTHRNLFSASEEEWYGVDNDDEHDGDAPQLEDGSNESLDITAALLLLGVTTGLLACCSWFLVGTVDSIESSTVLSMTFLSLALIPSTCNTARNVTAVDLAVRNKMDLVR